MYYCNTTNMSVISFMNQHPRQIKPIEECLLSAIPDTVLSVVSNHFSLNPGEVLGSSRKRCLADARFISIKLIRDFNPAITFFKLAQYFRRDHSTMIYGLRQAENLSETDQQFKYNYNQIKQKLLKGTVSEETLSC